jgi:DNA-binding NarL/FixJ family response regulator
MGKLNLFIVANNALVVNGLRNYLKDRFGEKLNINNFYDSRTCLRNIRKDTQVIVTDYFLGGRNAEESLRSVKEINPSARIVLHSSREQVAAWIDQYCRLHQHSLN